MYFSEYNNKGEINQSHNTSGTLNYKSLHQAILNMEAGSFIRPVVEIFLLNYDANNCKK